MPHTSLPSHLPSPSAPRSRPLLLRLPGRVPGQSSLCCSQHTSHAANALFISPSFSAVGLCLFGFLGAFLGGANVFRGGLRVVIGGWLALGIVYGIGRALNVDTA